MSTMSQEEVTPAPGWRRTLAGLIDVAIAGSVAWRLRPRVGSATVSRQNRSAALFGPVAELVREQLGTPGQRLLGVRTVDRRTGRRVELWRTLVLFGARIGGQLLARRLTPAVQTPEQERQREPWRFIGPWLAFGLLNSALRRRLAPTTEVPVRPR
jgi:uncharacterized RDD family membrane protein YckC